jgi:hypothetical protein
MLRKTGIGKLETGYWDIPIRKSFFLVPTPGPSSLLALHSGIESLTHFFLHQPQTTSHFFYSLQTYTVCLFLFQAVKEFQRAVVFQGQLDYDG